MNKLQEHDWVGINSIIKEIHQVHDHKRIRTLFLEHVKELIDYDLGIFDLSKLQHGKFNSLHDPVVHSQFEQDFEEQFLSSYDHKYFRMSYTRWIHYEKEAFVYNETAIINEEIRKRSQYYTEYLEPQGLIYCCGCNIVYNGINLGAVTFYRTNEKGDFDERDLYILEQLQPHLINKLSQCVDTKIEQDAKTRLIHDYDLTEREMEIIHLVYAGLGNQEIAEKLCISINTVKKHMSNIFSKVEIKSRSQLNHFLNEHGFQKEEVN